MSLDEQIKLFEEVTKELRKQFKTEEEFSKHISKAVFYINAGSNDYGLGYFNNATGLGQKFAPQAFPVFLADQLSIRLKVSKSNWDGSESGFLFQFRSKTGVITINDNNDRFDLVVRRNYTRWVQGRCW